MKEVFPNLRDIKRLAAILCSKARKIQLVQIPITLFIQKVLTQNVSNQVIIDYFTKRIFQY
jgi:hypothetical protein